MKRGLAHNDFEEENMLKQVFENDPFLAELKNSSHGGGENPSALVYEGKHRRFKKTTSAGIKRASLKMVGLEKEKA